ncbi:methyltransferase [Nocardia sp. NPDC059246]|uniref:methyltransferase n=1 Tax=unclassified Nocardia TaxID=2637762 RepID=UPI00368A7A97
MPETTTVPELPPTAVMMQILGGFQTSQAAYVVAKLGIATILEQEGSKPVAELAERTGAQPDALRRLIRTLAPLGLFATDDDRVSITPLGATLSETHAQSLYDMACMWMETHYLPFSELLYGVRTGRPAAEKYYGQPILTWLAADPERAAQFARAMAEVTSSLRTGMFDGYRLPAGRTVADIGGGDGSVLVELLTRSEPNRQGIVFDQPNITPEAEKTIAAAGLAERVDVVAGDFFAAVPTADIYVLGYILHDWDDVSSRRILASIAAAAAPGARVLVIEGMVPAGDAPHLTKAIDLTMLGMLTGKERSEQEYRELLDGAGFTLDQVVATPSPYSILEATLR